MGTANFKQYDSRWGKKNYNGSSTMAQAGCGPTAVADIVHNVDPNITPWKVAKWMKEHGYAIRNNGTAWSGIPAALKHFGLENVMEVEHMADVFSFIKRGYKAVFLMKAGKRGGVVWTTSGHFICVSAYKHEDGKHWFWTRDPGGRGNNGWHSYEGTMKNLIAKVWVCKVPTASAPTKSAPKKPAKTTTTAKGQKICDLAIKCSWKSGTPRSTYGYPQGKRRKAYIQALKKAYGDRKGWGKQTRAGASCDVFVGTVVRASGIDKKFPRGRDEQLPYLKKSKKWKSVSRDRKKLKKGDIIEQKYKSGGSHIMIYVGNGKVANAHYNGKTYPIREKYSKVVKPASKCSHYKVYRAV